MHPQRNISKRSGIEIKAPKKNRVKQETGSQKQRMHTHIYHGRIRHDSNTLKISAGPARFRQYSIPRSMHQTGLKNKAGRTQDFPLYTQERIILDMQNKDIQLSDITNEEEERGSTGPEKGPLRDNSGREKETGESQTS